MKLLSDENIHKKYLEGVRKLSKAVGSTLGARGMTVALQKPGYTPQLTKDGVTVVKFFDLEDPFENLAVQILKESSIKTSTQAGDGTTTTIVLAESIYRNAIAVLSSQNINPVLLKRRVDSLIEEFVDIIKQNSIPVKSDKDIENIATISANNDPKIGKLVAEAFNNAGLDGAIKIDNSVALEDSLEITEGYQLMSGYKSSIFINDPVRHVAEYRNPLVMVTDEVIESAVQLIPVVEICARAKRPLVIIASSVEDQALATLVANRVKKNMEIIPIDAPKYFSNKIDVLEDLATALGAKVLNPISYRSIEEVKIDDLGTCEEVIVSKNQSVFVGGAGRREDIKNRIDLLNSQLIENTDLHECEAIQERISKLGSCVVTIKIGAPTDIERTEKFYRVEDALEAVRSAIADGVLPGGGVSLLKLFKKIEKPQNTFSIDYIVWKIFSDVVKEPLKLMLENAGIDDVSGIIKEIQNIDDFKSGFDIYNEKMCDLVEAGIIDPTKVVICSLINSSSVATTLLTSKYAIIET